MQDLLMDIAGYTARRKAEEASDMAREEFSRIEGMVRNFIEDNKKEIEKVVKSFEPVFNPKGSSSDNNDAEATVEVEVNVEDSATNQQHGKFNAAEFKWDPSKTYSIAAPDKKIVTGCVIFDDKLSFTKCYNASTQAILIQTNCALSDVEFAREATPEESQLLQPEPTLEESLRIVSDALETPYQRRAWEVVMRQFTSDSKDAETSDDGPVVV